MQDLQKEASDPKHSVWVSASAGTGKTKILTDRFLRLLVKGEEFENILCLTFTNNAALEMQTRISNKLKNFSLKNQKELEKELFEISGKKPSSNDLKNARNLYNKLLNKETPLNIFTIHAFCQKILKTFSLEASITPEFKILDQSKLKDVFLNIRNEIYLNYKYTSLISILLNLFHETTLLDIFDEIIEKKLKFKKLFNLKQFQEKEIKRIAFKELQAIYNETKILLKENGLNIDPYELFFTKGGEKRKNIFSHKFKVNHPKLLATLESISINIYKLEELNKIEKVDYYSNLLTKLADIFLQKYELYKEKNNLLDYDDLIYYTENLLTNNIHVEWLVHKLGNSLNHILIDEAQDTSADQWNIISSLLNRFYENNNLSSSIFVVGDEKQSIFSFQGADLTCFNQVNNNLQVNLAKANKEFKNITLKWSYRSVTEILQTTYKVLDQIKHNNPELFPLNNPLISSFRTHKKSHIGSFTIWPLFKPEKQRNLFWSIPSDYSKSALSYELLIEKIIDFIKNQIKSKTALPSTNRPATEKDFMVLVRKRDEFSRKLIVKLKQSGLKAEGAERMLLKENLSVMDLIAAAKFVLSPLDDLNLAALLKSPIINMSEAQLQNLVLTHTKGYLWHTLFDNILMHKQIYQKLGDIIEIYNLSQLSNFFLNLVNSFNIREILNRHNGFESDSAINELLSLSLEYSNNESSLQGFIAWFENNDVEIKKDIEQSDKIKIMTVHSSKGLEAPIVILCDSTTLPKNQNKFIWTKEGEVFYAPNTKSTPKFLEILKKERELEDMQEYIRLLYVAMTRAADHLIICGYSTQDKIPENCWYNIVSSRFCA